MRVRLGLRQPSSSWLVNTVLVGALSITAVCAVGAGCSSQSSDPVCESVVPAMSCMGGEDLRICASIQSNECYFMIGEAVRANTCSSCDPTEVNENCYPSAAAYCAGSGSGGGSGGSSGSSSGGGSLNESCGYPCPSDSTCIYATYENTSCNVGCASGTIAYVTETFGTNCPSGGESCAGSASSCEGSTSCPVLMTDTTCVTDPCPGTVKDGSITIACSGGTSSGSSSGGGAAVSCGVTWGSAACANCISASCCSVAQNCAGDPACRTLDGCIAACNGGSACINTCESTAGPTATSEYDNFVNCYVPSCENTCGSGP